MFDGKAFGMEMTEVVKTYVDNATAPLLKRIADLEARQPEKGERGEKGDQGEAGQGGIGIAGAIISRDGELVLTLSDGTTRDLGVIIGKDGESGADGGPGADGRDGVDGKDGIDGVDGKDADMELIEAKLHELVAAIPVPIDGKDGADGKDADMPALEAKLQELVAAIPIPADGRDGVDGQDAYPGEAKGLYDPEAEYRAMDVVSLNGAEWRAKQDSPGPLPGDGWMLSAQRGKRGDRGEKGDRGGEGKSGKDGAQPIALAFDADEMKFLMVLDDGNQLEADFYPVAKAIRGD